MTCAYFEHEGDEQPEDGGLCKRYPPQANYDPGSDGGVTVWPGVGLLDWCGKYATQD